MQGISNNLNEFFPAKWFPEKGNKNNFVQIKCELVGTFDISKGQPVKNLLVSSKGTTIRTSFINEYKEYDDIEFLGRLWQIERFFIDLSALNPQAAAMGDVMKNAVYEFVLIQK